MKLYDCTVLVETFAGGQPMHTVPKRNVSEMELKMLRGIHGHDRVQNVKVVGDAEVDEQLEPYKLARFYGDGGAYNDGQSHGVVMVKRHLGIDLPNFDDYLTNVLEQEEAERVERERARQEKFNRDMAAAAVVDAVERVATANPSPKAPPPKKPPVATAGALE